MNNCHITENNFLEKLKIIENFVNFVKSLHIPPSTKVLDIVGFLEDIFKPGEVYLLNINPNDVKGIEKSFVTDATKTPFKEETWDIITSFDVIEHLINPDDFLAECFRVLKRGGWFVLSTPNLADLYSRITFLLGYTPFSYDPSKLRIASPFSKVIHTDRGHKSVFTFKHLKLLLEIHGFKIIWTKGYPYCDDFYLNLDPKKGGREIGFYKLRKALNVVLPNSLREGMLFICQKPESKKC
jgi:SAM-dependent methyltransferase